MNGVILQMNDFTKEELQLLNLSLKVNNAWCPVVVAIELNEKIQSMIDNYCEHEHKHYDIGDSRPVIMTHECLKCGKEYINE